MKASLFAGKPAEPAMLWQRHCRSPGHQAKLIRRRNYEQDKIDRYEYRILDGDACKLGRHDPQEGQGIVGGYG